MVRASYIDKNGLKKGAWSKEEDDKLKAYIQRYGYWNWRQLPKFAGLQRCGKSCRIRWLNYLRQDVKRGGYSKAEDDLILQLHEKLGSKWAKIAEQLPGRTDNEIKNHWHTCLKKREKQNHGTPNQDLEEKAIESSQFGVDIPDALEGEAEKTTTTVINPSHPVILESSAFSPTTSSIESSSSDSTLVDVLFDGDELNKKSSLRSEEEDDKLRACIQKHGLSSGRTEWNEQPSEICQCISTEASDFIEQPATESRNLLTISTPVDPMLDSFPLTPESTSSGEFFFFSSDLNMADTMTPMDWFEEENSNPFEIFESDFWTEPYVLDTAGTKSCSYPSCLVDWQFAL